MKLISLSGASGFARGLTLGRVIKDICIHDLSFLRQELTGKGMTLEYGLKLASENEKVLAKHFPELLEEIRGVAEEAQLPYSYILLETAFPFGAGSFPRCTVVSAFGTTTTCGTPIVGRNYDFFLDFKKCNQLRVVKSENKEFSFAAGTITMLGVEEGLNNAGLFIGDAGCETKELPPSRGLSSRQLMQLVLENCTCIDAAIDFIRQAPKFANNAGTCYLLSDKRGSVVIEMGLTRSCLRESEEGILVACNAFLTSIVEEIKPLGPTAFTRHDLAKSYLQQNKGRADGRLVRGLLSDHSIPVCSHNEINTLRSATARTDEKKILVADGYPCTPSFEEIRIPT